MKEIFGINLRYAEIEQSYWVKMVTCLLDEFGAIVAKLRQKLFIVSRFWCNSCVIGSRNEVRVQSQLEYFNPSLEPTNLTRINHRKTLI